MLDLILNWFYLLNLITKSQDAYSRLEPWWAMRRWPIVIGMTSTKKLEMTKVKWRKKKKKCYEFATMERALTINLEGIFSRAAQQHQSLCYNLNNYPAFWRKVTRLQLDSYSLQVVIKKTFRRSRSMDWLLSLTLFL